MGDEGGSAGGATLLEVSGSLRRGRMREWVGRRTEDSEAKARESLILELTCGAGA